VGQGGPCTHGKKESGSSQEGEEAVFEEGWGGSQEVREVFLKNQSEEGNDGPTHRCYQTNPIELGW